MPNRPYRRLAALTRTRRAASSASDPGARAGARKRRIARFAGNRIVNPVVRAIAEHSPFPVGTALLETTGRRSGLPRRTPVGNGLRGREFWIVTEHGWQADYVKNIQADPRVRVKVGRRWMSGTATILPDDDPYERLRWLGRRLNDTMLLLVGTQQLTIRVDLD